jgi:recombinational DNA repair protein (RecF pathway)
MSSYRDTGIILQKYELGEADALLTILLQDAGLTRVVAKGVRRQSSRKRGHVELFNQVDCLLAQGRNLDILTEVASLDIFENWRQDLAQISLVYYAVDLTLMIVPEQQPQPVLYQQLVQFLAWIGHAQHPAVLARWYEVQLLHQLGYWPPDQLSSQSQNAVGILESFSQATAQQVAGLRLAPRLIEELERLMASQIMTVVERQTKSQSFVEQIRDLERRSEEGVARST